VTIGVNPELIGRFEWGWGTLGDRLNYERLETRHFETVLSGKPTR
jgi:hypothetical protein